MLFPLPITLTFCAHLRFLIWENLREIYLSFLADYRRSFLAINIHSLRTSGYSICEYLREMYLIFSRCFMLTFCDFLRETIFLFSR